MKTRISLEDLDNNIQKKEFIVHGVMTICILTLKNGFLVEGISACADPASFNKDLGEDIAFKNARDKMWPLMGYALKEEMYKNQEKDWRVRLKEEHDDLDLKIIKLSFFLGSPSGIDKQYLAVLNEQLQIMKAYKNVLHTRLGYGNAD